MKSLHKLPKYISKEKDGKFRVRITKTFDGRFKTLELAIAKVTEIQLFKESKYIYNQNDNSFCLNDKYKVYMDQDDFEKYKYSTFIYSLGYLKVTINGIRKELSHVLLSKPLHLKSVVVHLNGNKLDYRKKNLKIVLKTDSSKYKHRTKDSVGVHFNNYREKWISVIYFKNTKMYLGQFDEVEKAKFIYDKKAWELGFSLNRMNFTKEKFLELQQKYKE